MNAELIRIVDGIARDKNIEREQIYTDIEQAIASGLRKHFNTEDTSEFQVQLDRATADMIVNLGRVEGIMPRSEQIPGEAHQVGERVQALIMEVRDTPSAIKIILSRA